MTTSSLLAHSTGQSRPLRKTRKMCSSSRMRSFSPNIKTNLVSSGHHSNCSKLRIYNARFEAAHAIIEKSKASQPKKAYKSHDSENDYQGEYSHYIVVLSNKIRRLFSCSILVITAFANHQELIKYYRHMQKINYLNYLHSTQS
jgi:hypothetical protein